MTITTDRIALSLCCTQCGDGQIRQTADMTDNTPVHCPSCHTHLGAWAEVKEQARAAMFDALRDDFSTLGTPCVNEDHHHTHHLKVAA